MSGIHHDLLRSEAILSPQIVSYPLLPPKWEVRGKDGSFHFLSLHFLHLRLHPSTQTRQFYVSIQPPVGELMAPVFMSENEFKKEQGECFLGWTGRGSAPPMGAQEAHGSVTPRSLGIFRACASGKGFTESGTQLGRKF